MVEPISKRKCATIVHKKADLRTANFRLFLCGFFCVLFLQKKDRFSGLNLCRFAKRNRHAFDFDFRGDKRGSEAPLFSSGNGHTFAKQNVCHSDSLQYLKINVGLNVTEKEAFILTFIH